MLDARFQDITEAGTRLLTLTRLKLNNREMAGMLDITIEGVKAKQRLRKKTGLSEEDSLEALIAES